VARERKRIISNSSVAILNLKKAALHSQYFSADLTNISFRIATSSASADSGLVSAFSIVARFLSINIFLHNGMLIPTADSPLSEVF